MTNKRLQWGLLVASSLLACAAMAGTKRSSAVTIDNINRTATGSLAAVLPSAEQQRAAEAGSGVVQRAIAAGTWTRQDTADLHSAGDMGAEALMELRRQIAVAINEDRLKVEPGTEFRW